MSARGTWTVGGASPGALERPARGRPRDARCDAAILGATLDLVRERGVAGTTVEAVAARAGVGKATIYRRWPSRDELLRDALSSVGAGVEVAETGDVRADLKRYFKELARHLDEQFGGGLLPALVAAAAVDPAVRELVRSLAATRRAGPVAMVRRAVGRGRLRPGTDPEVVVDLIAGALFYRLLVTGGSLAPRSVAGLVDVVLDGVGV
jgi:AcrR family transcriptional regulator